MTTAPTFRDQMPPSLLERLGGKRLLGWIGFLVVHLALGALALNTGSVSLGDVATVYEPWAQRAATGGGVVGIDEPWVYPILALVPILIPIVLGPALYPGAWLTMVLVIDAGAFAVLLASRSRRATAAAWWWLAFLLLLGPIAVTRLDAVSVPPAIVGLLIVARRPAVASVLLTIATWIKVWPAALIAAAVVATRHRWRIVVAAVATSAGIALAALVLGAGPNLFSFVTVQADRGLQIEAPVSTYWMWQALSGTNGSFVYYDRALMTFQVTGSGIDRAIALMTPLLAAAAVAVLLIGVRAVHRGATMTRVLPALALALVTVMIAFNKVGSPQYVVWLAAPVIAGLVFRGRGFAVPAALVAVIAALTQVIYPYLYIDLLRLAPYMLVVLTIRNILYLVVLYWSVKELWFAGQSLTTTMSSKDPWA